MSNDDQSIRGSVIIPLLRAIITGLLVGLLLVTIYGLSLQVTGWRLFWAVLAGVSLLTWLAVSGAVQTENTKPEIVYPQEIKPLKLAVTWNGGQEGIFSEMGITREQFITWAAGVSEGRSLGENHWTGSRGVFSKGEYHAFRDELERRGFLRPRGRYHAQGYELTKRGEAVCNEIARRFGDNGNPPIGRIALIGDLHSREVDCERVRE